MDNAPDPAYAGDALGSFVARSRLEELPAAVVHEAKRALLNFVGGALSVAHDPAIRTAIAVMLPFSGADRASVIGSDVRLDAMGASFVNAIAANLLDYDDTHPDTIIHPTAPVAPAALALAELRHLSTRDALHAFVLGAEVECRIGNAVSPGHYARGWHITSTCGVFGAAAACARLLGLDARQTWSALGIAASQSTGLIENLTSAAKNVSVGNAARNGLLAALLAQGGYSAAPAAIEGPLGWARAMGDAPRIGEIVDGLGERWAFARNTYKPYPAGIVLHCVIDACFALREKFALVAGDIARVSVTGPALLLARGDREVHDERDARVSIQHCVAIVFARGAAGVDEFSRAAAVDPEIAALRQMVHARLDPRMAVGACRVEIETRDGRIEATSVASARGSVDRPLTDGELESKFRDNARRGGAIGDVERQIAALWRMDGKDDAAALMRLLTPGMM